MRPLARPVSISSQGAWQTAAIVLFCLSNARMKSSALALTRSRSGLIWPPGSTKRVVVVRFGIVEVAIDWDGVTPILHVPAANFRFFGRDDLDDSAGLLEPVAWSLGLCLFEAVGGENSDFASRDGHDRIRRWGLYRNDGASAMRSRLDPVGERTPPNMRGNPGGTGHWRCMPAR